MWPPFAEPIATEPNGMLSWEITELRGPEELTYFHRCVNLDLFRRCAVAWLLARVERTDLSKRLISDTIVKKGWSVAG